MQISEVREHLNNTPFIPFRLHVSDGSAYDIPHPEYALLARWAIHVGIPGAEEFIADRGVRIAISHVTRIEELEPDVEALS